jgi:hypothetical protein
VDGRIDQPGFAERSGAAGETAHTPEPSPKPTVDKRAQSAQPIEGVVQASLLPPTASLPQGFLVGQISPRPSLSPFQDLTGSVVHGIPAGGTPSPARLPESKPEPALQHEGKHSFSEGEWRRLQTIFSKHQEKSQQASPAADSISMNLSLAETPDPGIPDTSGEMKVAKEVADPGMSPLAEMPEKPVSNEAQTRPAETPIELPDSPTRPRQGRLGHLEASIQPGSQPQKDSVQAGSDAKGTVPESLSPLVVHQAVENIQGREITERYEVSRQFRHPSLRMMI